MAAVEAQDKEAMAQAYLNQIRVDEDDPGMLVSWDLIALESLVAGVNRNPQLHDRSIISTKPGQMTSESFTRDVVTYAARVSGGRCDNILLAPNTLEQFAAVVSQMSRLELEPFMQQAAAHVPQGRFLASLKLLRDRSIAKASGLPWPAPRPGVRQLFH